MFDEATKDCVAELYERAGYSAVRSSETEEADLAAARDAVADASDGLDDAQAALEDAQAGPSELEVLDAEQAVDTARNNLNTTIASLATAKADAVRALDAALRGLNAELVAANPDPPDDGTGESDEGGDDGGGGGGGGGDSGGGGGGLPGDLPAALEVRVLIGGITDVDGNGVSAGDTVAITAAVSNVGQTDVDMVAVTADRIGADACGSGPLHVGEERVCTPVSFPLDAADLGQLLELTAAATASPPSGVSVEATGAAELAIPGVPDVRLDKQIVEFVDVDGGGISAGDVVRYSFRVVNTGNVPLAGIEVFDPMLNGTPHGSSGAEVVLDGMVPCGDAAEGVPVGGFRECDVIAYHVTAGQLGGVLENTAEVTAAPPTGPVVTDEDSAAIYLPLACTTDGGSTTTTVESSTTVVDTTAPPDTSGPATTAIETTIPTTETTSTPTSEPTTAPPTTATTTVPPTAATPPEATPSATTAAPPGTTAVATPSGFRSAVASVVPPCPGPGPTTTTTTSTTTTTAPPPNAPVPSTIVLPEPTPDAPPAESGGGGGVVILDDGSDAASEEDAPVIISGRIEAATALTEAMDGVRSAVTDGKAAVEAAQLDVERAERESLSLRGEPQVRDEERAIDQAGERFEQAESDLATLEAASGPTVPLGELVFVPSLPARVDSVAAVEGDVAGGANATASAGGASASPAGGNDEAGRALLVLAPGRLVVKAQVSASDSGLVTVGSAGQLLDETTGDVEDAGVERVGSTPVASPAGGLGVDVVLSGASELPLEWSGRNVRVTFATTSTSGPVLAVPLAAVTSRSDGSGERVRTVAADGTIRDVAVSAGISADGLVEITPQTAGSLSAGDVVVTGFEEATPDVPSTTPGPGTS